MALGEEKGGTQVLYRQYKPKNISVGWFCLFHDNC